MKLLAQENVKLCADIDLTRKDAEEEFVADRKRLEDQVKTVVDANQQSERKLTLAKKALEDSESARGDQSKRLVETEEEVQRMRGELTVVQGKL